ncbi:uncharacterized protein LOC110606891 isoform X2 [Manihot esculenta]|uniref:Uncharacterized protein n=2 Tax=Manihot esculenta TaxID=3983 RepID=A0ACB7G0S0_MANES|nr:uncharacterized protein LOC110606891 isoform X2 [Manihot esculenta]KAG8633365.1 hypothetical protein MANES_18G096200v8 [Manihot esculenta]OAY23658.1 hypothetical protein MANES_18G096200v8 [Manihot esculenta]
MAIQLAALLRTIFFVLGSIMVATLIYTISIDGLPFRRDLLTPWMAATLVDFYINVVPLAAWIYYKESNSISAIIWIILLVCLGSIATCAYIFIQFLNLSPEESLKDPIYHVLLRHEERDGVEKRSKHPPVVVARIAFSSLGCLMLGTLIYTSVTDGSPFRKEVFTPWMVATLVDFYINVVSISVWFVYKESSWIHSLLWITLLVCVGSVATCAYIVIQLLQLASQDPLYLVLFAKDKKQV